MADAKGIRAGSAFVELFADDAALQKGLKAAEASVKGFGVSVGKIGASLAGLGGLITAPLIAATNLSAESGSELAHMAERTGMSVEALSVLGYAAKQSGTDLESVEVAVKRLQKAMTAGPLENQQAAQTFANLGLNVQQLMRLKPDQQFEIVAKRLAAVQNPAARAGASMMLFGRSGTALLPLIEHLGALSKEAKDFGLVTSTEAADGALKLEHSMKLLDAISRKIMTTVGSALGPMFEEWNTKLAKVEKSVLDLVKANKPLVVMLAQVGFGLVAAGTAIALLSPAIYGLGLAIGEVSAFLGVIYSALLLLTTPLGLIAVGFVATTVAMGKWGDMVAGISGFIKTNFGDTLKTIEDTIKGISDALKAGDIQLAAQVLFAGLKVEFLKGTVAISKLWHDWGVGLVEEFRGLTFGIARSLIDLQAKAQTIFGRLKANVPASTDITTLFPRVGKALGIIPGGKEAVGEGAIEERRAGAQAALGDAQDAEEAARRKAAADALAAAEKELANARLAADIKNRKAAAEAAEPEAVGEGGQGPGKAGGPAAMTPEGLDKGLKEAAAKVDVAGTFSGAAAAGLGVGTTIEKDPLAEQKKANASLEKIKKNTEARAVFT